MTGLTINVRSNADSIAMEFMAAAQEMRDTALVRALNKTAEQAKVAASREIRNAGYKLKVGDIKRAIKVRRASQGSLTAAIVAAGRPIPLIQYSARQTSKGVSVSVLQGRRVIAGAFIATMPSGHRGVFVREPGGKHRKVNKAGKASWHQLPIRELYGPSVPNGMASKAVQEAVQRLIAEKFPQILRREHAWLKRRAASVSD